MRETPFILQILQKACERFGYHFQVLDPVSHALVKVSDGKYFFYAGYGKMPIYPLNSGITTSIANDKEFTHLVLKNAGFRIPNGKHFFLFPEYHELREAGHEKIDAFEYAKELGYPVFVKPNRGSHGRFAEIIHNEEELQTHLENIAKYTYIAHVQEVLKGNEYRIFIVDGEIMFSYQRSAPCIIGDGKSSIAELADEELEDDLPSEFFLNMLKHKNLSMESILPENEKLPLLAKANIKAGGTISDIREDFPEDIREWAKNIAKATQLRVLGVDIFAHSLDNPKDFVVLEVNQNPSLSGMFKAGKEETVMKVWKRILENYFQEKHASNSH